MLDTPMRAKGLILAIAIGSLAAPALAQPKVVEPPKSEQQSRARQPSRQAGQLRRPAYFPNCDAARAAGAAPIYAGQAGYRAGLDRDGDGIACEPYRGR